MVRKVLALCAVVLFSVQLCGCFALLAGAAGGAGTAAWLSGKLTQDVNSPFDRAVQAADSGLRALKFDVTKKTVETDVAQLISQYRDGKTIWVDVHRLTSSSSRIAVRVGVGSDKPAADEILRSILRYL